MQFNNEKKNLLKMTNLKQMYEMTLNELAVAQENIIYSIKYADNWSKVVRKELENPETKDSPRTLYLYDSVFSTFQQILESARKFNFQADLRRVKEMGNYSNPQQQKNSVDIEKLEFLEYSVENVFNDKSNTLPSNDQHNASTAMRPRIKEIRNGRSQVKMKENFTYDRFDISEFKPGQELKACISHLIDADKLSFYVLKANSETFADTVEMQYLLEQADNKPIRYTHAPAEGEVFGLSIEENILFRAVRENIFIPRNQSTYRFRALLLDYGEIVVVNGLENVYQIPGKYKKYSAQFFRCQLVSINNRTDIDMKKILIAHSQEYQKDRFDIVQILDNVLHVNMIVKNLDLTQNVCNEATNGASEPRQIGYNPFTNYCKDDNTSAIPHLNDADREALADIGKVSNLFDNDSFSMEISSRRLKKFLESSNGAIDDSSSSSSTNIKTNYCSPEERKPILDSESSNSFTNDKNNIGHQYNGLDEAQKRILFEEPLNTTNAMKAVMGYNPKDDERICKFYDSSNGGCFKGVSCKLEHVERLKDGWTRDQNATIIQIPSEITMPKVGSKIQIVPTHVVNAELFYCHKIDSQHKSALLQLGLEMNAPEEIRQMQEISPKSPPALQELVLAKYKDGNWYRARIFKICIEIDEYKVFYVDYGNFECVSLDRLRKWNTKFSYLPFQAIKCRLAGIKEIPLKRREAVEYLREQLLTNQEFTAEILDIAQDMMVHIKSDNGYSLSVAMIEHGLVTKFDIVTLNKSYLNLPA